MNREKRIPFEELANPETIEDQQNLEAFWPHQQDMHRDECTFEDDHTKQERILRVRSRRSFFFLGGTR